MVLFVLFAVSMFGLSVASKEPINTGDRPQYNCTDSDNGKDYYVKGTTVSGRMIKNDYCSTKYRLVEYYCRDNGRMSSMYVTCPGGGLCTNGVCNQTGAGDHQQTVNPNCTETDDGKDITKKGTTSKGNVKKTDHCYSAIRVLEYYCGSDQIKSEYMACPTGKKCADGICVEAQGEGQGVTSANCTDSDNGKDVYTKGTTTLGRTTKNDYCSSKYRLIEYYCTDKNRISSVYVTCPGGGLCINGACNQTGAGEQQTSQNCTDSDNGKDYYVKGTTKKASVTKNDYCSTPYRLVEYYCSDRDAVSYEYKTCPESGKCENGACSKPAENPGGGQGTTGAARGTRCSSTTECAQGLVCKPSGRYGEQEKYCCGETECASVMSGHGCVGNDGTDVQSTPNGEVTLICNMGRYVEQTPPAY